MLLAVLLLLPSGLQKLLDRFQELEAITLTSSERVASGLRDLLVNAPQSSAGAARPRKHASTLRHGSSDDTLSQIEHRGGGGEGGGGYHADRPRLGYLQHSRRV